jgi:hypothetical protein
MARFGPDIALPDLLVELAHLRAQNELLPDVRRAVHGTWRGERLVWF